VLTIVLLLDDLFMIHEYIAPVHFHVNEKAILVCHACGAAAYLLSHRRLILAENYQLLVAAMVLAWGVGGWRYRAPAWTFVAGTHVVSRFLTSHIKDATGRLRPSEWLAHGEGATFFAGGIGFPSGHVVLFASLALPIVVLSPRWWPLLALVVFAGAARVAVGAHFLSDVLAAVTLTAAVAWAVGWLVRPLRT